MKNIIVVIFLLFSTNLISQTIVSTTPENRKVIIEEFTGVNCSYCPQGHALAQSIMDNYPGNAFAIAIHAGNYASEYTTTYGTTIKNSSGVNFYPSACFNRNSNAVSRTEWYDKTNDILAQSSCVNVAVEATLNTANRQMSIHVEIYYTANSDFNTNYLNIAILQDSTISPQNGGGDDYVHMHRFVDFVTGQWGEVINTTTSGTFIDRTYTYTVPANYSDSYTPAILENLKLVVFVAENQYCSDEIITGNACQPTIVNLEFPHDAMLSEISPISNTCQNTVSPEITLLNTGQNNLSSAEFEYSINGGDTQTYSWSGNLDPTETETISLPEISYTALGVNTLNVTITTDDDNNDNNSGNLSFNDAKNATETLFFEITTDLSANETAWEVINSAGETVYSVSYGTYSNNTTYNETFNLPAGCYTFKLYDGFGDGGCTALLKDNQDTILLQASGNFGQLVEAQFQTNNITASPQVSFSNASTNVSVSDDILMIFNMQIRNIDNSDIIDPATLISFVNNDSKSDVNFTASVSENKKVITIHPTENLQGETSYTISMLSGSVETFYDIALENDATTTFTTEQTTGISEINNDIAIYPNPTNGVFNLTVSVGNDLLSSDEGGQSNVIITNITGKTIKQFSIINNKSTIINLQNQPAGIYFIKISTDNNIITKKIIKK